MYAVIRDRGRQHTVRAGDRVLIDRRAELEAGAEIRFDEVLLIGGEGEPKIGTPTVAGAAVVGKVLAEHKAAKVIVFKKRKRKDSKCKNGHRQRYTAVTIESIEG